MTEKTGEIFDQMEDVIQARVAAFQPETMTEQDCNALYQLIVGLARITAVRKECADYGT